MKMPVDRNPRTGHHLLRPHGEIVGARRRTKFDEDVALVPKMNEMFSF
jgi:hypothetical protein